MRSAATSDPASGSVIAKQPIISPDTSAWNTLFFLFLRAELEERQSRTDLHVDRHPHGAVRSGDFFGDQHHGEKAESVSAVVSGIIVP